MTPKPSTILSSSVAGAAQLLILQVWSRMSTFVLNQLALRFITREVLGFVALEMELLSAMILFLSREFVRMAALRSEKIEFDVSPTDKRVAKLSKKQYVKHQKLVNFGFIPMVLGAVASASIAFYANTQRTSAKMHYTKAVNMYCLAAFLELCIEPLYILAVNNMFYNMRVRVEGAAVLIKCLTTLGLLVWKSRTGASRLSDEDAVMSFAWSQIFYSLTLIVGYMLAVKAKYAGDQRVVVDGDTGKTGLLLLIPRKYIDDQPGSKEKLVYYDSSLLSMAWTFAKQGSLKFLLTEGDKLLSVSLITEAIQGDYALVEKYGSLIARILFQPLEETGRLYFAKALGSVNDIVKSNALAAADVLTLMLRLHVLLGFFFVFIGTNYARLLIYILAGSNFSNGSAPFVLAVYCIYVPIMGVNGITEAYVQGLAGPKALMKQSYWMGLCWVAFIVVGYSTISSSLAAGAVGIVAANCVNLMLRIWFSWAFIRRHFLADVVSRCADADDKEDLKKLLDKKLTLSQLFPRSPFMWITFSAAWLITYYSSLAFSSSSLRGQVSHLAIGVACGLLTLAVT
ncbi:Oligosaccharide translocation protein rft1 [Chytridiales sp. JEL 0842]|nr:Oligosaccharide translocation protein rft1 [Chytridiales sp. JEL 0842]